MTRIHERSLKWMPAAARPTAAQRALVRFADGSIDYRMWTPRGWFPAGERGSPVAWLPVELVQRASSLPAR